ncbi:MAG: hypothetical protein A2806_04460 [Candidatus Terrybacteria bacterium RIFCSPHIGHO2_01_FULL_48_17]|uniref:Uncharacterized protein n=1 Tax=Candidatus Terrybacteria bacterium RIFCSPHIGHO2_01_FULL_48_17 TaxID=1802362 RepID=A0A1G2PKS7_9BACT|nr:MAG: hypothetical protein A2806_04460 [Candidatus Terrybacteria bacterium RIFCSPHIGHO2_01_FULL_48_17]
MNTNIRIITITLQAVYVKFSQIKIRTADYFRFSYPFFSGFRAPLQLRRREGCVLKSPENLAERERSCGVSFFSPPPPCACG